MQSQAKQALDTARALPAFSGPTEAIDTSSLSGKTVWVQTIGTAIPFVNDIAQGAKEALQLNGIKVQIGDGKFSPQVMAQNFDQAVAQRAGGIVSVVPPVAVGGPLAKAATAKIPMIQVIQDDKTLPLPPGVAGRVEYDVIGAGKLVADYMISKEAAPFHVGLFEDSEYGIERTRAKAIKDELKRLCPACKVQSVDILTAKNQTDLAPAAQTMLRKDPEIHWMVAMYDGQLNFLNPAVEQAGGGKVKTIGADNVGQNLGVIAKHGVQTADVGPPGRWSGWAAADLVMRAMLGKEVPDPGLPVRFVDETNIGSIADPAAEGAIYGSDYVAAYKKLWGRG